MKKWIHIGIIAAMSLSVISQAAETDATDILRSTGKAFSQVAKDALPAVVFIDVETTIEIPQYGYRYQPFRDLFGRRGHMAVPQQLESKKYSREGQGSGFIISKDGYILTNNHVVKDADRITVILADERKFSAKIIGSDPKTEVALIKIDDPQDLPFIEIGDSDALEVGEWVLAAGNPFGLTQTLTSGIVSAKGRDGTGIAEYGEFIQTDAAINPGNSGGPLLNIEGEAIGINTAIYTRTGGYMGIGFAIPINQAIQIKNQLIEHGTISRSVLGIYIQDIDEELAESFGLEEKGGILISQIIEDSAAEEAGLHEGDIIIEMEGEPVGKTAAFRNKVASTPPNTALKFRIFRNGKYKKISAITKAAEEDGFISHSQLLDELGFAIDDIDSDNEAHSRGVVITEVDHNTPAWRAGLKQGYYIESVNRKEVNSVSDFMKALKKNKDNNLLLLISDGHGSRFVVLSTK